jgi:hypothetical protein
LRLGARVRITLTDHVDLPNVVLVRDLVETAQDLVARDLVEVSTVKENVILVARTLRSHEAAGQEVMTEQKPEIQVPAQEVVSYYNFTNLLFFVLVTCTHRRPG